jgi:hypothetical protein
MPKKVLIRTAVHGDTPNARRVLAGVTQATEAPPPLVPGDGILLSRNEHIHLFFQITGDDPKPEFKLNMWWYSPISGIWHKGEQITVNDDDIMLFDAQGLDRLALELHYVGGGSHALNAWAGLVVPV